MLVLCYEGHIKVVLGREFPQKNVTEWLFRHILQDTIFLQNGEMYNFVCRLILSQISLCMYCPWFSRNNSISGTTSLKALRKESLGVSPNW